MTRPPRKPVESRTRHACTGTLADLIEQLQRHAAHDADVYVGGRLLHEIQVVSFGRTRTVLLIGGPDGKD